MIEKSADKILCVDDEDNILHMFRRTLGRQYDLYTAFSGEEALKLLCQHADFALIISDYSMPSINGTEFLKLARELSPNSVQIMLTGNIDLDVAIKTITETNIFRYLPKPCPIEVLRKVIIDALNQYHLIIDKQRLDKQLEQKNAELAKQKLLLEYELEMARIVYSKVYAYGHREQEGLDYFIAAKETVGGDFLLTHASSDGQYFYLMVGDLTGHGLQSALAVFLVTEIFDAQCAEGPGIEQLAQSINDKMCGKLPTGLFCAALLARLDLNAGKLHVWQGGMPDAYLLNEQGQLLNKLPSNNLPLGVLAGQDLAGSASCHKIGDFSSLFVYSDGVIEQLGGDRTMFGDQRLRIALSNTPSGKRRIDHVMEKLREYQQQLPQCDDISLIELHLSSISKALESK